MRNVTGLVRTSYTEEISSKNRRSTVNFYHRGSEAFLSAMNEQIEKFHWKPGFPRCNTTTVTQITVPHRNRCGFLINSKTNNYFSLQSYTLA